MPLLLDKIQDTNTRLAVWKVTEPDTFFLEALSLTKDELAAYEEMRPHRQKEWLSSRFLLNKISDDKKRKAISKSELGKPYRKNCNKHISISHSKTFVAVIISDYKVGIDIQVEEEKITRIAHKFINKGENARIPKKKKEDYYHVFWGAKESMYKAYGLKELEFLEHMHLYPFVFRKKQFQARGWVRKNEIAQDYNLFAEKISGTYLVYSILDQE